jgi:hypothetical protein
MESVGCHAGLDPASTLALQYGLRVEPAMTAAAYVIAAIDKFHDNRGLP